MDTHASPVCRSNLWGFFLIAMALGWAASMAGWLPFEFWPFVGVAALVVVGVQMLLTPTL